MKNVLVALMLALFIGGCGGSDSVTTEYVDRNVTVYVDRNVTQIVEVPVEVVSYVDREVIVEVLQDYNVTLTLQDLEIRISCLSGDCTYIAGLNELHMVTTGSDILNDLSGSLKPVATCQNVFTQFMGVRGASTCSLPECTGIECDLSNH